MGRHYRVFLFLGRVSGNLPERLPAVLGHAHAIAVFMIGRLIFRSCSREQFLAFLFGVFDSGTMTPQNFKVCILLFAGNTCLAWFFGIVLALPVYLWLKRKLESMAAFKCHRDIAECLGYLWVIALLLICYMPLYGATSNAFIHFRF